MGGRAGAGRSGKTSSTLVWYAGGKGSVTIQYGCRMHTQAIEALQAHQSLRVVMYMAASSASSEGKEQSE